jgi:uncharacterized protein
MSFKRVLLLMLAVPLLLLIYSYWEATSTPRVRRANIELRDWPAGAEPVTVVLISDIHVAGPDMPPGRLRRIVGQINDLDPDLVLIAGDLVSDKRFATRYYSLEDAMAPLAALKPRLGTFAVLGNHDHWRNAQAARRALKAANVRLIENSATAAGPLAIGGLDDDFTGRADVDRMAARLRRMQGARLVLSHSPDPFAALPPDIGFMVAGHTHCGQIVAPFYGPLENVSRYGMRYQCGLVREDGRTLVVTAGLGTSVLPLRFNAPPDLWLLELGPKIPPA